MMNLKIITSEARINELQKALVKNINKEAPEEINCIIGYPGGSFEDKVIYISRQNLWFGTHEQDFKFWNGFGYGKPIIGSNISINGEINFPKSGINRRIAGAFAEDLDGRVFLLHRGKIGGGKKGVGKEQFMIESDWERTEALDGDRTSEFFLVSGLDSDKLVENISLFIGEIRKFKLKYSNFSNNYFDDEFSFTPETFGSNEYSTDSVKLIERTHGIIVKSLADIIQKKGLLIGNDKEKDLFIHNNKNVEVLFEIKTDINNQTLATGIGQLLLYSKDINPIPKKYIVLPESQLDNSLLKLFNELNIGILLFKRVGESVEFSSLDDILK